MVNKKDDQLKGFDSNLYMKGMRYFGSAVHIVTTGGKSGERGLTVSACCSLTNHPPMVLCCLYASENNESFVKNNNFCVNSLSAAQENLAMIFSGYSDVPSNQRFQYGSWERGKTGAPILKDGLMSIECSLVDRQKYSTHYILIGQVVDMHFHDGQEALMYLNREFYNLPIKKI